MRNRLIIHDTDITLQIPKAVSFSFRKENDGRWATGPICIWDKTTKEMVDGFSYDNSNFLNINNIEVKADRYEVIQKDSITGISFFGSLNIHDGGDSLDWQSTFTINTNDSLPLIHQKVTYTSKQSFNLKQNPQVLIRTSASGEESADISNIMGYLKSNPGGQIVLEQGYPAVWVHSNISGKNYNCLGCC